jgi:WD40 repeat protein
MKRICCLICLGLGAACQLNGEEPRLRCILTAHRNQVVTVCFSSDGKTLASGGCDNTIRLWDVGRRSNVATLTGHASAVLTVAFARDRQTLASADFGGSIVLWDLTTGKKTLTINAHGQNAKSRII